MTFKKNRLGILNNYRNRNRNRNKARKEILSRLKKSEAWKSGRIRKYQNKIHKK